MRWTLRQRFAKLSLWNRLGAVGSVASVIALALWFWPISGGDADVLNAIQELRAEISSLRVQVVSLRNSSTVPTTAVVNGKTNQGIPGVEARFYASIEGLRGFVVEDLDGYGLYGHLRA